MLLHTDTEKHKPRGKRSTSLRGRRTRGEGWSGCSYRSDKETLCTSWSSPAGKRDTVRATPRGNSKIGAAWVMGKHYKTMEQAYKTMEEFFVLFCCMTKAGQKD